MHISKPNVAKKQKKPARRKVVGSVVVPWPDARVEYATADVTFYDGRKHKKGTYNRRDMRAKD